MKTTSYYPVLTVEDVAATADFYKRHFSFVPVFECDWYAHLQSSEDKRVNLGLVRSTMRLCRKRAGRTHAGC